MQGHTTRAHIIFMREVIPKINPDAVILLLGINDLGFSITKNSGNCGSPYDYYKPGWKSRFFFNSRLLQILYKGGLVIFNQIAVEKKGGPGEFRSKPLTDIPIILPNDLKILLPCLNQYRENVKEIIRLAKSMKTRIILLTQPSLFDDTPYWRGIEGEFYWVKNVKGKLSAATHWKLLDIYNKELMEVCKDENVECIDLASLIPHSKLYFYDITHFNEKGAELVAEKIIEFLKI